MCMVSSAVGYAAAAMGFLASHRGGAMRVQQLAEAIGAPPAYLSKIVHMLGKRGFFDTARGKGGGVALAADPRQVTLYDLCEALADDILHPRCALGVTECSDERACPAHDLHMAIRARQLEFLRKTTVQRIGDFNAARERRRPPAASPAPTRKGGARP